MGALADMLAKSSDDSASADGGDSKEDPHKLAEASIKAFFEAGKAGDYSAAADHFASAMQHCGDYGDTDAGPTQEDGGGSGMPAVMLIAHKK